MLSFSCFLDVCCGEGPEKVKGGKFVTELENGEHGDDDEKSGKCVGRPPSREKAAVALELKKQSQERQSIFSSPVDVHDTSFEPPVFEEKTKMEEEFLRETMESHLFFQELTETELQVLIRATEKVQVPNGERVVRQNEHGEYLYIIQEGELELYCDKSERSCGIIGKGNVFGELSLLYGQDFPLSVISRGSRGRQEQGPQTNADLVSSGASSVSVLWRVDQKTFRYVLACHAYKKDTSIQAWLRKVDLFQSFPETKLLKFANSLTRVHFQQGDTIVRKGEKGEIFYVIEEGSVRVHDIGIGDSVVIDQVLKPGDAFGERALLTGEPRAATVTALTTNVTTLAMDRRTFEEIMGDLQEIMDLRFKQQTLKSLPVFANSDLSDIEYERLAEHVVELSFRKGTKLFEAGKPYPSKVWFLRKGRLLVYGGKSGKIFNLQTGDYIGDKSILGAPGHISSHEATCEENVDAWVLSREDIESVIVDLSRLGRPEGFVQTKQHNKFTGLKDLKKHRVLGRGAFGKVWLVEGKASGKPFALKEINKRKLLQSKQERGVIREKELLCLLHHPFILNMVSSFQDADNLYLVLPLIQGGELFNVIASKSGDGHGIPNDDAAFYAGGIIEALGHFHHRYIAYRDLKLENVMIDAEGYIKIVDLGFAKVVVEKSYTFCGTPEYLAPEIIMSKGHNHAVDYWSFGVLLYEMLAGRSPFNNPKSSQMDMFKRIVLLRYEFPLVISDQAKDLIKNLLLRLPRRLGCQSRGHYDIRDHPWFVESGCYYKKLLNKEIAAPWLPEVKSPFDSSNFDDYSAVEKEINFGAHLSEEEQAVFAGF